jgi:hypothetical protein
MGIGLIIGVGIYLGRAAIATDASRKVKVNDGNDTVL